MVTAYIGVGSNLCDPVTQVQQAIAAVAQIPASEVTVVSSLYGSRPMGPQDQPDYINAVLALTTELTALELLEQLQAIENQAGRVRKDQRWGARIIDLDVLLYGQQIIDSERLTVPHYGMHLREFVLIPLAEIAPDLRLPDGSEVKTLSQNIATNGLAKLSI